MSNGHGLDRTLVGLAVDIRACILWHVRVHAWNKEEDGVEETQHVSFPLPIPRLAFTGKSLHLHVTVRLPWKSRVRSARKEDPSSSVELRTGDRSKGSAARPRRVAESHPIHTTTLKGKEINPSSRLSDDLKYFVRTVFCGVVEETPTGVKHYCSFDCTAERVKTGRCSTVLLEFLSALPESQDFVTADNYAARLCAHERSRMPMMSLRYVAEATATVSFAIKGASPCAGARERNTNLRVLPMFFVGTAFRPNEVRPARQLECVLAALSASDISFLVTRGASAYLAHHRYRLPVGGSDASHSPTSAIPKKVVEVFCAKAATAQRKKQTTPSDTRSGEQRAVGGAGQRERNTAGNVADGGNEISARGLFLEATAAGGLQAAELYVVARWLGIVVPHVFVLDYCPRGFENFLREFARKSSVEGSVVACEYVFRTLFGAPKFECVDIPFSLVGEEDFSVYRKYVAAGTGLSATATLMTSWFEHALPLTIGREAKALQTLFTSMADGDYLHHSVARLRNWNPGEPAEIERAHKWTLAPDVLRKSLGIDNLAHMLPRPRETTARMASLFDQSAVSPFLIDIVRTILKGMVDLWTEEYGFEEKTQVFHAHLRHILHSLALFSQHWVDTKVFPYDLSIMHPPDESATPGTAPRPSPGLFVSEDIVSAWDTMLNVQHMDGVDDAGCRQSSSQGGPGDNDTPGAAAATPSMPSSTPRPPGTLLTTNVVSSSAPMAVTPSRSGPLFVAERPPESLCGDNDHEERGTPPRSDPPPAPDGHTPGASGSMKQVWNTRAAMTHSLGMEVLRTESESENRLEGPFDKHTICFRSLVFAVVHTPWSSRVNDMYSKDFRCTRMTEQSRDKAMLDAVFANEFDFAEMAASIVWSETEGKVALALDNILKRGLLQSMSSTGDLRESQDDHPLTEQRLLNQQPRLANPSEPDDESGLGTGPYRQKILDRIFFVVHRDLGKFRFGIDDARGLDRCTKCKRAQDCGAAAAENLRSVQHRTGFEDVADVDIQCAHMLEVQIVAENTESPLPPKTALAWTAKSTVVCIGVDNDRSGNSPGPLRIGYVVKKHQGKDVDGKPDGSTLLDILVTGNVAKAMPHPQSNRKCWAIAVEKLDCERLLLEHLRETTLLARDFHSVSAQTQSREPLGDRLRHGKLLDSVTKQLCDPGEHFHSAGRTLPQGPPDREVHDSTSESKATAIRIADSADQWLRFVTDDGILNDDQVRVLEDLKYANVTHLEDPADSLRIPIVPVHGPPGTGKSAILRAMTNLALLPEASLTSNEDMKKDGGSILVLAVATRNSTVDDFVAYVVKEQALFSEDGEHYLQPRVLRIGAGANPNSRSVQDTTVEYLVNCSVPELPKEWQEVKRDPKFQKLRGLKRERACLSAEVDSVLAHCKLADTECAGLFDSDLNRQHELEDRLFINQTLQKEFFFRWAHIIAGTSDGVIHEAGRMLKEMKRRIDFVFVEEASLVGEVHFYFLCTFAITNDAGPPKLVLCTGDDRQGPVFTQAWTNVARARAAQSPFKRLRIAAGMRGYMLKVQYRMSTDLWALPQNLVYSSDGQIASGSSSDIFERTYLGWHNRGLLGPDLWLDSGRNSCGDEWPRDSRGQDYPHFEVKRRDEATFTNPYEVHIILSFLRALVTAGKPDARNSIEAGKGKPVILVIAPYRAQVNLLTKAIYADDVVSDSSYFVICRTMDSAQGMEAEVTILSLVRSKHSSEGQAGDLSFILQESQVTVAITRQRCARIIVGNAKFLKAHCPQGIRRSSIGGLRAPRPRRRARSDTTREQFPNIWAKIVWHYERTGKLHPAQEVVDKLGFRH